MGLILFLLCLVVILVIAALVLVDSEPGAATVFGAVAMIVLLPLVFSVAPHELGYSRVPNVIEAFTKRLEVGVVYEVDAIIKPINATDYEKIIIVHSSLKNYRAIYVKVSEPIPTRFTLIDGQPVEVK